MRKSTRHKSIPSDIVKTSNLSPSNSGSDDVCDEEDNISDSDVPHYEDHSDNYYNMTGDEDFEDQGSSDDDEYLLEKQIGEDSASDNSMEKVGDSSVHPYYELLPRKWNTRKRLITGLSTNVVKTKSKEPRTSQISSWIHTDDLSSDDEDDVNRIGKIPLHWYDEYDHIGYGVDGEKVMKSASSDGVNNVDRALANADSSGKDKFIVHDALNNKNVKLTARQLELIRRIQNGAYAHPEFDGNAEYIDYFSGVDPEISGINSNRYVEKSKFQPSKWDKMQVEKLLEKLEKGFINIDYLSGKIRDMNDAHKKDRTRTKTFLLWTGGEENELNMKKGPQHIAPPKNQPPGHAESYIPPDEYIPTEEEINQWEDMEPKDRPHGLLVPKKFPNLRSLGAYEHSVRESFERCLDLYLCPRTMKRRLNIDPESLVPKLPKAIDLRPFPTAKCIQFRTPYEGDISPVIRCVTASPDGQFMARGASDGFVRLWETETGRLLRSWNASKASLIANSKVEGVAEINNTKPIVSLAWNPNPFHHCLLAAVGSCAVIIATGTEGQNDAEVTNALFSTARRGGNVSSSKASKVVQWVILSETDKPVSAFAGVSGPICALHTKTEMAQIRWHNKGDYFVTISPKAGAPSVLIHQLSKGNSQQPFNKAKDEAQTACFHPNKPFLFVASQQHVRVYHLIKQSMVKRLISGCRWISSLDIHPSGDHLIVGSLDRRMVWFDLDLSHTPYKTLKYHERAVRDVEYHHRYPLMASASDDGAVHIFHSMVYFDLMRNPLIVPVKILRGHTIHNKHGVLSLAFHPTQPWIFTAGADGRIFLYQDI